MKLAVNYSAAAADLVRCGQIELDYFKCPAWPALVREVRAMFPTFVHFPLQVGAPGAEVLDGETGQAADWGKVERLLAETDTRHVNLHLAPQVAWFPEMAAQSIAPQHTEQVAERLVQQVQTVVHRFGPQRVIVENDYGSAGATLVAACLPDTISRVVAETGCGLLLDLSHARLAAAILEMDPRAYVSRLPVTQIQEIHVTGIQRLSGHWLAVARRMVPDDELVRQYAGQLIDHLPMRDADWRSLGWALAEIRRGAWREPWALTFEYGGVSSFFEAVTDATYLAEQVPRLYRMLAGSNSTI